MNRTLLHFGDMRGRCPGITETMFLDLVAKLRGIQTFEELAACNRDFLQRGEPQLTDEEIATVETLLAWQELALAPPAVPAPGTWDEETLWDEDKEWG